MTMRSFTRKSHTVVELVSWQKWRQLQEVLRRWDDEGIAPVYDDRTTAHRLPEDHVLHLACQHQAPTQIVEALAARYPRSASTRERVGRHPLHIACARGVRPRAIDFLVRACPAAVGVQDEYGKTCLHYVCESYAYNHRTQSSNASKSAEKCVLQVISLLLERIPGLANVEDRWGMNAIEYALENDADLCIVKLMQNKSRDNWRNLRKAGGGKRHEELRRSVGSVDSVGSSVASMSLSDDAAGPSKEGGKGGAAEPSSRAGMDVGAGRRPEAKVQAARMA